MDQNFTLRDVLNSLFKHKYKIVAVFFLVAAPTYVISSRMPLDYMAKAVIMVNFGREFVPIPEVGDMRLPAPSQDAIINTEIELISGRELTDKVINVVGAENLYPDLKRKNLSANSLRDIAGQTFGKNLLVRNISKSNLIEVAFKHEDPR